MLAGCPCWQSPPLSEVITMSVSGHIPLECSTAVLTTTRHSRPWSATRTVLTATTQRDSNDDDRHSRPPVSYSYSQQQRSYSSSTAMTVTDRRGFRSHRLPRPLSTALSIDPHVWSQKREGTELFGICSQTGGSSNGPCSHKPASVNKKNQQTIFAGRIVKGEEGGYVDGLVGLMEVEGLGLVAALDQCDRAARVVIRRVWHTTATHL